MPNISGAFLSEGTQIAVALAPDADRWNADPATDVFNMALYDHITFIVVEGVGATGTTVLTVEECTDAAGAGATAIAFKSRVQTTTDTWGAIVSTALAGLTTTAGSDNMYLIEVPAASLSDASNFVRVQTTESVDSPVDAAIIAVLWGSRYSEDVMPTSIV